MAYMLKDNVQQEYYMQPAQKSGHTEISLQFFLHFQIVYILLNSNFYRWYIFFILEFATMHTFSN